VTVARPMRLALLGCGYAARLHARTLRGVRGIVPSYASRDIARAKTLHARYGGAACFGSYDEALARDDIDAVAVLTPPASHLALTLRALAAGKDVILEKPPLMRARDFDAVEQACARHRRRVFVAENYHYKPLARSLRRLLAAGAVGDVLFLHLNAVKTQITGDWRDDPARTGAGALFEGGIHWVHFMANLGLTVQRVRGARSGSREGVDRSMLVTFEYAEGAVGTLAYSWDVPSVYGLRMSRIYGTSGSLRFETNGVVLVGTGTGRQLRVPGLRDLAGYKAMFRDFLDAWRTGREPAMTLASARHDLELIEAAYASAALLDSSNQRETSS